MSNPRVEVAAPDEAISRARLVASQEGAQASVRCQPSLSRGGGVAVDDGHGLTVVADANTEVLEAPVWLVRHEAADEPALQDRHPSLHR